MNLIFKPGNPLPKIFEFPFFKSALEFLESKQTIFRTLNHRFSYTWCAVRNEFSPSHMPDNLGIQSTISISILILLISAAYFLQTCFILPLFSYGGSERTLLRY